MGNLFGRKRRSRVTEQDKAVLQLKQQRDKLKQYQKRISLQLERERTVALQLLKDGKKEKAKLLLKKKRYQEQLLDKTDNQISNLERMVQDIEFTQIEMKVIEGLKIGNECLNKMHQVMSIEEVERIMDETQEAIEYQRQIDEMLAGSFTEEDEDAILAELDAITQKHRPTESSQSRNWWQPLNFTFWEIPTGNPGIRVSLRCGRGLRGILLAVRQLCWRRFPAQDGSCSRLLFLYQDDSFVVRPRPIFCNLNTGLNSDS
ncbi:charged multivesicular body protein 6 isoform X1 [Paroedura picta]|uniref:charged multivesicular body protein 6 isoform X1 n=1 Tax=Paroedura picta TaxID=143630 RepID=UPI004056FF22